METKHFPFKRITPANGKHYFFGYFDKSPWDFSGRRLLAHQIDFTARQPRYGEKATVGILEADGTFEPVGESLAWCWQQGSMLQWFSDHEVIWNDIEGFDYCSRIFDLDTGKTKTLCRPVYCLTPDRKYALSINFARLDRERPGYGYTGVFDSTITSLYPEDDGIWLLDVKCNKAKLIISLADIVSKYPRQGMVQSANWFNHLLCSPDSRRFAFFHRWRTANLLPKLAMRGHLTHMFTANIDGSEVYPLNLEDMSSHYSWTSDGRIICYARRFSDGDQYYLFRDGSSEREIVAQGVFPGDGHCTFSSDGRLMLTDSYPRQSDHTRGLYVYDRAADRAWEVGRFYADPKYISPARCDLHPRFSADGKQICFDSIHEGFRGIYIMNLTEEFQ